MNVDEKHEKEPILAAYPSYRSEESTGPRTVKLVRNVEESMSCVVHNVDG